jgi:hypothetical protein
LTTSVIGACGAGADTADDFVCAQTRPEDKAMK